MLVLARKAKEDVNIKVADVTINVKVIEIKGEKVRLGFDAPRECQIWRGELTHLIR